MLQIQCFIDCFSHVKIAFLPKNTTSKLQPLPTSIIKNFKVFNRKQLLQYLVARIKPGYKESDVMSNVNLLKSIEWVMENWRKIIIKEQNTNCFAEFGFNEDTLEFFIDDDADAEFAGLQNHRLRKNCLYSELFWSAFPRIRTRITPNTDTFHLVVSEICLPSQWSTPTKIKHGWYTCYRLEGGHEGKSDLLRDLKWRCGRRGSWSRWWFWYWTTRVENTIKSRYLIYCRWSEQF